MTKSKQKKRVKNDHGTIRFNQNVGFIGIVSLSVVALKECINIKIQQALAKDYGLIEDITYDAFLKELSKENRRRKEANVEINEKAYNHMRAQ